MGSVSLVFRSRSTDAGNLERVASQNSQEANRDDLHLQLVFFDLLELDGQSHVESTYEERRATLQQVVRIIPGWTMLAARTPIRLDRGLGMAKKVRSATSHIIETRLSTLSHYQRFLAFPGARGRV